jgi:hypothetical protein
MKRYFASTTSGWNPGDDFIFHGVRQLLPLDATCLIWNRCPDNFGKDSLHGNCLSPERLLNCPFKPDAIVIAGTPEWSGGCMVPLYEYAERNSVPVIMIGIGFGSALEFSDLDKRVLESAALITARDHASADEVQAATGREVPVLPCPSIFMPRVISATGTETGYVWQSDRSPQGFGNAGGIENTLPPDNPDLWIAHYIEDYFDLIARGIEPSKIFYSHNWQDYLPVYAGLTSLTSMRLHGAAAALAMGVPVVRMSGTSARCTGAWELLRDVAESPNRADCIHKHWSRYAELLAQHIL